MLEQIAYDTIVISCILISSGYSASFVYGAAEELYYRTKQ